MNSALALSACLAVAATLAPVPAYSVDFLPPTSITLGNSYNDAEGIATGDISGDRDRSDSSLAAHPFAQSDC